MQTNISLIGAQILGAAAAWIVLILLFPVVYEFLTSWWDYWDRVIENRK